MHDIKLGGREKVHHDSLIEICVGVVVSMLVLVVVVFICHKMHAGRREHGLVEVDSQGHSLNYNNIQFEQFLHGPRKFSYKRA